ncbi:MAG: hypothetical protein K2X27_05355 [Candidatus Obscuribacterales bacterium]|nr:hypothetical protein [Candidatus Obscuribacterales bacterium]
MPPDSLERLRVINQNTGSAKHVILTLTFGLFDPYIRRLNKMITGLLLRRLRAERAGDQEKIEKINDYMKKMHDAIDEVTGVKTAINGSRNSCNRIGKEKLFSEVKDAAS